MCAQIIQNIHDAFLDSKRSDLSDLRTAVISAVKEALREEILKNNPYKEPTNLYQLLANGALEEIDWEKLAQALVLLYEDGYFQIEAEISGDEEWEPKRVAG